MHSLDRIRFGDRKVLVAALQLRTTETFFNLSGLLWSSLTMGAKFWL